MLTMNRLAAVIQELRWAAQILLRNGFPGPPFAPCLAVEVCAVGPNTSMPMTLDLPDVSILLSKGFGGKKVNQTIRKC